MEMACEHQGLTLVLAEVRFKGEGGGAVLAMRGRAVRQRSEHGMTASGPRLRRSWPNRGEQQHEGTKANAKERLVEPLPRDRALFPNRALF
jgi:hypothetical protein